MPGMLHCNKICDFSGALVLARMYCRVANILIISYLVEISAVQFYMQHHAFLSQAL